MATNYKKALNQARRELIHAIQQRDKWFLKIMQAQRLVRALATVVGETESDLEKQIGKQVGIADAVEAIINSSGTGKISASEVRSQLASYGYDIENYANPASLVNQTLERLADAKRINRTDDGKYRRSDLYEALLNS